MITMPASAAPPRLLLVEDDEDTRAILEALLHDEGYAISQAPSPREALDLLHEQVFHLLLTDLAASAAGDPLRSVAELRAQAQPTPIGVMTGWKVSLEAVQRAGFACLIRKPFDIDDMLATIASSLRVPLSPTQQRQAEVVDRFFAALNVRDWETALGLCTDQLAYYPSPDSLYAPTRKLAGKANYRAYVADVFGRLSLTRFENLLIYARPKGLAARYTYGWASPDGRPHQQASATLFHFSGDHISHIGVKVRQQRIRRLIQQQRLALAEPSQP